MKQFPKALNWYSFINLRVTNLSLHCALGCDATGVLSDTTLTPLSVRSVDVFLLLDFLLESLLWRNLKSWPVTDIKAKLPCLLKYRMIPHIKLQFLVQHSITFWFYLSSWNTNTFPPAAHTLLTRHVLFLCILIVRHWLALGHMTTAPIVLMFRPFREVMYISRVWWECWKYILQTAKKFVTCFYISFIEHWHPTETLL